MKTLYEFFWDCGRMGEVEGLFIADEKKVQESFGTDVYFGEILGKHSEIYGTLEEDDLRVISTDQDKIEWLQELMRGCTISGYNPMEHLEDE